MDRKWTLGPWLWDKFGTLVNPANLRTIEVAGLGLAHFSKGDGGAEAKANAHLISAAPDMYEALSEVLSDLEIGAHPHLHIKQIRAALAKAEGRTG